MAVGTRSLAVALAVPVIITSLAACGTPEPKVSAVSVAPVAAAEPAVSVETVASVETAMNVEATDDASWECPQDVRLLQALQTAHENLIGRPAQSVAELEVSGILRENHRLAATIDDGNVVGTPSDRCAIVSYTELGLDERCAAEIDRLGIDIVVGSTVAEHLGSSLGAIEQARAVGVDHGPYSAYAWNDDARRLELLDPTCPDHDAVVAALRAFTEETEAGTCRTLRATLHTASEAYQIQNGMPPLDQQQMVAAGFLRVPVDQYDLAPDGSVVVEPGSECEQFELEQSGTTGSDEGAPSAPDCHAQRMTLETAVEAYYAVHGRAPADEQTLVDVDFLRELSGGFDLLADGTVVAAPGGGCE